MKVLHLINTLSAGGAELHLVILCRCLQQAGVEVVVAYLKEGRGSRPLREDFEREGIRVVALRGEQPWDGRYLLRALRLVRQEEPDLIHTHLPRADLVGYAIRRITSQGPWICSVHGIYSRSWRARWALPLWGRIWRRADKIIAISGAVREWLVHRYGIPSEKVQVVYYGIEPERFQTPSQDLRRAWGLRNAWVIGTVGRLEYRKGHDVLIRAMPFIRCHIPEAILLIAGHDSWGYGRRLQNLVDRLGLKGRVRLVGFQSDVCSFLHSLDIFAFASRSEGFGQVLIEAMAAGKPVVASRIAPITEIVAEEETGLLSEPDDPEAFAEAITRLLFNPGEAQRMGQQGRDRVRMLFSADRMTQETLEVYRQLLGTRHG